MENLTKNELDFLVYLIEIVADKFFDGNKKNAYLALNKVDLLVFYKKTYDVSHTLSTSYILDEIKMKFNEANIL